MVSIGVAQLSLWQRVHFWSPSRDRSVCASAESEPKSTETLAQIRKSRISLRIFFLRVRNLESLLLTSRTSARAIRVVLNFSTDKQRELNRSIRPIHKTRDKTSRKNRDKEIYAGAASSARASDVSALLLPPGMNVQVSGTASHTLSGNPTVLPETIRIAFTGAHRMAESVQETALHGKISRPCPARLFTSAHIAHGSRRRAILSLLAWGSSAPQALLLPLGV